MVSRIASLRLQLIDAASGPAKGVTASMKALDSAISRLGKSSTPEAKKLVAQLEELRKKSGSILEFRGARRGLKETSVELKLARSNVQKLEAALASAAKPTKQLESQLKAARAQLKQSKAAFLEQGQAVRASERAMASYGINSRSAISKAQQAIRNEMAQTIRQIRSLDRELRKPPPPAPPGVPRVPARSGSGTGGGGTSAGAALVGGAAANAGRSAAERGFGFAVDYSEAENMRNAAGNFSDADKERMNAQAKRIGGLFKFSNADVLRSQSVIVRKGIQAADQVIALTDAIAYYALALRVTMEEGAETVEGIAQARGIDASDVDQVRKLSNQLVAMAIKSGMDDNDIRAYNKFSAAPAKVLGFTDEQHSAFAMALRRRSVPGAESGTFTRAMASYLIAPTNPGRAAMANAGIDYNQFAKVDAFDPGNFQNAFKGRFGKDLTPEMQQAVADLIDPEKSTYFDEKTGQQLPLLANQGEFVARLQAALEPLFVDKKGKVGAQDSAKVAKFLNDTYQMSIDNIDAYGLLREIMAKMGPGEIVKMFGSKQGARAQILQQSWGRYEQDVATLQGTPDDYAEKIGRDMNAGLYGDWTRLTGTIETALTNMVNDFEGVIRPTIRGIDSLVDDFSNLDTASRQLITGFLAAASVFGAYKATRGAIDLFDDLRGGGKGGKPGAGGKAGGGKMGALLGIGGSVGTVLGLSSLVSGDTANNAYANASPEERERMRKQSAEQAGAWNAASSSHERYKASTQQGIADAISGQMARVDTAIASWPDKAKDAMYEYGGAIQAGGADAEAKAAAIASRIQQELSVTGHPDVDTARLERALTIARQVAAAVNNISSGGGGGGYVTPANSNKSFGGPRAHGGSVSQGKTYLVGERGPEPFIPSQNGRIVSNGDLRKALSGGGGVSMVNHFYITGNATRSDAEYLAAALERRLMRSAQTAFSSLRYGDA